MLPAEAAVGRFIGVDGRLRVGIAAVLARVTLEQRLDAVRAQPRERARGIGQRGVVDVGVGRFACCRVVLAELITDGHGVGRALPRAAVGQPGAAHGAVRAVGHDGVFVQVERLLGRELHVEVVAAFGLIADVCVGEVLERHGQLRRVARGARFVAVEHLLDLRQTRARVGERVFAHQHLAVRELVGQLQTGDAGVVRDLFALRHDGAVDVLHGLNILRLGERGAVTGSTKTDWCIVFNGTLIKRIGTKGINPFFQSEEEIQQELTASLLPQLPEGTINSVYFYGAGCTPEKAPVLRRAIADSLPVIGNIKANSDMLAAARGLCGHEAGIACILGTGSNSCFYNGEEIISNISPLGFILGDEGSGAVLGKLLVGDVLKNQLPSTIKEAFLKQFDLTVPEIIDRVYRQPFPNRFLASLSPFLAQHLDEPAIRTLVLNSFIAFLRRNVMQYDYKQYPAHFIGSVAHCYKDILQEAAQQTGIQVGKILQSPMEGLIQYHQK